LYVKQNQGSNKAFKESTLLLMAKNKQNISFVVKEDLCTGCGTCVSLCPTNAIEMVIDQRKGIYVPLLNKEKCTACGQCVKVCPGHEVDFKQLNQEIFGKQPDDILLGNYLNCYTGHATDYNIRYNASSGGLVTALLTFALEQKIIDGALVTRMKKDKPLEPEPFIARTREEIIEASRSKYCPVPANIALKEILQAKDGEKFAVVGLPCHLHGIRKAELVNKIFRERIVLHIGIFCGCNNTFKYTDFLIRSNGIKRESVTNLEYRGHGWPGFLSISLNDKSIKLISYEDYIKFHNWGFFTTRRCTLCCEISSELADISCGDAWIPEIKASDKTGVSLIITRTEFGKSVLNLMENNGKINTSGVSGKQTLQSAGNKRANLAARILLNKLIGKTVPNYNIKTKKPRLLAYPYYLLLYVNLNVSKYNSLRVLIKPLNRLSRLFMR
jgi:coenzyme F420 hydrogenase subunit beta